MKQTSLTLFCMIFVVVAAADNTKKLSTSKGPDVEENVESGSVRPTGKRWLDGDYLTRLYPIVPNKFARSGHEPTEKTETDTQGQEKAREEKTFRDYISLDGFKNALINLRKADEPIVDTATDEEKNAPNEGDKFEFLGAIARKLQRSRHLGQILFDKNKFFFNRAQGLTAHTLRELGNYISAL